MLGALTKPDTVEPGDYQQWVSILRGQSHTLPHGYFVTKQPNQDSLNKGIDNITARQQEEHFFATTEPWATELRDLNWRFGTPALAKYLARELGELIRRRYTPPPSPPIILSNPTRSLPSIIETIESQLIEVTRELGTLPVPPQENYLILVHRMLSSFSEDVCKHLTGEAGKNAFQAEIKQRAETFSSNLRTLRPNIMFHETLAEELADVAALKSNRKPGGVAVAGTPATPASAASAAPHLRRTEIGSPIPLSFTTPRKRPASVAPNSTTPTPKRARAGAPAATVRPLRYTLPRLRHLIDRTSTSHIPNLTSPEAMKDLSRQSLSLWKPVWDLFFTQTTGLMGVHIRDIFAEHFRGYEKSPVFNQTHHIVSEFLNQQYRIFQKGLERLYHLEWAIPATLNKTDFNDAVVKADAALRHRRERNIDEQKRAVAAETPGASPDDQEDQVVPGAEFYARELHMMAETQAYCEIARKRFVDNVFLSLLGELLRDVKEGLLKVLKERLDIGGEASVAEGKCRALLEEDPELERRRVELLGRGRQLKRAKEELGRFVGMRGLGE